MKKITLFLFVVLTTLNVCSQNQESTSNENISKNLLTVSYRLFPTENRWTFIKLNTRNGKMWQVQYDTEGEDRFEIFLNYTPLVDKEQEMNDRFTLYPTKNMWTFILLDQHNGKMWQVQWSIESKNRFILPIE